MSVAQPSASRARDAALAVWGRLRDAGHEAWFVGGSVRDELLGRPAKDIDIATSARPAEVEKLFPHVILVGAQFGVCRVRTGGVEVEVAAFRSDQGYADGRHPTQVRFTDAREDVLRRDFTINGMLQDPLTGEIVDHVGGRRDLELRLVRAIGDPSARFAEDRLRMLRAVRIAARLDFQLEPATEGAIREHAEHIREVSAERIRDELRCIVTEGRGGRGLRLLEETGLRPAVLPELAPAAVAPTARLLDALGEASDESGFAALLSSLPETAARACCQRLRLSRHELRLVVALVADLTAMGGAADWPLSRRKRLLREEHGEALLGLAGAQARANAPSLLAIVEGLAAQLSAWSEAELRPAPLLDGQDLADMGFARGPVYKEILSAVEDARLNEEIASPEEAKALVRARFGGPNARRS